MERNRTILSSTLVDIWFVYFVFTHVSMLKIRSTAALDTDTTPHERHDSAYDAIIVLCMGTQKHAYKNYLFNTQGRAKI